MKFLLGRASKWEITNINDLKIDTNKWQITEEMFDRIDQRGFKNPEEYKKQLHENWFAEGTNHRQIKGGIERTFKNAESGFFIHIDTLEQLMEFRNEYGDIILEKCISNPNINKILIYDDYIE